jgi:ABC-type phosphate transport system substrate-binding protein
MHCAETLFFASRFFTSLRSQGHFMIPFRSMFALAAACVALAGCTSTGQLTPTASAAINTAYSDVCNALPALAPVSATMNANAKNAYAQAQTICAAGAPTNAITAGIDILAVENALLPYFKKATALAPDQEIGKRRVNFGNVNLSNLQFGE